MKFIIDIIEDVRETISNDEAYQVCAGLLKTDEKDNTKLIYSGEAFLHTFELDTTQRKLFMGIDNTKEPLTIKTLIPSLLIVGMDAMMYELRLHINTAYQDMEIVAFGKNEEDKKYILFIKV